LWMGMLSVWPSMRMVFCAGNDHLGQAVHRFDRRGDASWKSRFHKIPFRGGLPPSLLSWGLMSTTCLLISGASAFSSSSLNVFKRGWCGGGREDALHRLDDAIHVGGAFDVFDGPGRWRTESLPCRSVGCGYWKCQDTQFLEGDLNGHGEAADAAFVDLGRGVQHNEKGKEQRDEVGVADHQPLTT